jgi:hypothetical protein
MDDKSRLNLKKLVSEYNPVETTDKIRDLKHSDKIRHDISIYLILKKKYSRLSFEQQVNIYQKQCNFLFTTYTNIFNKLVKNELDLTILNQFLTILNNIENGKMNQHEGSVLIGQILKELYIDSALKKDKKRSKYKKSEKTRNSKNITWAEYKKTL